MSGRPLPNLQGSLAGVGPEQRVQLKLKQGRPHVLIDYRIVDDQGQEQPWDGKAFGDLQARRAVLLRCKGGGAGCWQNEQGRRQPRGGHHVRYIASLAGASVSCDVLESGGRIPQAAMPCVAALYRAGSQLPPAA